MNMAKNPFLAAFLSFLIPGLGQIYTGKIMMGIVLIITALILSTATTFLTIFAGILYIILWLYAIYDAYVTAKAT
jgi:TM2 domain-containing membrane protein YozV